MSKFCQSCGTPLNSSNLGTNYNNTPTNHYCITCYRDGAFTEPTITMEDIKYRGIAGIKRAKMNILKKLFLLLCYPLQLSHLDRWNY